MLIVIDVDNDLESFIDTIYGYSNFFHNNICCHFILDSMGYFSLFLIMVGVLFYMQL